MDDVRTVHTFEKNARERVHVALGRYKGCQIISIRSFYPAANDDWRPTPKGIAFDRRLLPELERAVANLRAAVDADGANPNGQTEDEEHTNA